MAIESLDRITLRRQISETIGDLIVAGTATAGSTTTLTDTNNILFAETDALKGAWVHLHTGTGSGAERNINASNTTGQLTIAGANWTAPSTDTQYHIYRRFRVTDYNNAINAGIRASRLKLMDTKRDISLLTSNNVLNGLFTNWTDSTTPTSWTAGVDKFTQDVVRPGNIVNEGTLTYYALVYTSAATIRVQVSATGMTTVSGSSHNGSGWNLLKAEASVPAGTGGAVTVAIDNSAISGGASLTFAQETNNRLSGPYAAKVTWNNGDIAYVARVFAPDTQVQYEYTLPSNFHSIHAVYVENGSPSDSDPAYPSGYSRLASWDWYISRGNVNPDPVLGFRRDSYIPASNRAIIVEGLKTPDVLSADTDTLDSNAEPIRLYAAAYLLSQTSDPLARFYTEQYERLMSTLRVAYPAGSRLVDPH